jgi:hypothetical protein
MYCGDCQVASALLIRTHQGLPPLSTFGSPFDEIFDVFTDAIGDETHAQDVYNIRRIIRRAHALERVRIHMPAYVFLSFF